jgi:uncharacterized protein (DUF488 family)
MHTQPLTIWTIGHSNRTWQAFLELLAIHGVHCVVDVRRTPASRKHPHFNQASMEAALREAGLVYQSATELGGRRKPSADSPNTVWRNDAFRAYADFMATEEYRKARTSLLETAAQSPTAILCSEAVWWRCHRSLIADDLKAIGLRVLHVLGPGAAKEHPYTAAASVIEGKLVYGPAAP